MTKYQEHFAKKKNLDTNYYMLYGLIHVKF